MKGTPASGERTRGSGRRYQGELLPREYLRIVAVWSLIPSYLIAGGLIGYAADRFFDLFPYLTGLGLIAALALSVRDMLRLRDIM